jgi:hypothetical protein
MPDADGCPLTGRDMQRPGDESGVPTRLALAAAATSSSSRITGSTDPFPALVVFI